VRKAAVLLAVLGLCGAAEAAETPQQRMLAKVNATRVENGLKPLRRSSVLERTASEFARWLVKHESLTHRPQVSTRAYPRRGEALAMHYTLKPSIGATLRSWLGSPVHSGLVLTTSMPMIGIGYASGRLHGRPRTIWVLQVARPS
jgi:uncharacterized protein YkwD